MTVTLIVPFMYFYETVTCYQNNTSHKNVKTKYVIDVEWVRGEIG